jgi:pimeloyl-ACP methyl ester carboxylesterase
VETIETIEIPVGAYRFSAHVAGPGDGRLVLLLHGFPQSSLAWRHQLATLAEAGYRAVAPDQRGYSPQARPEGVEHYATDHLVADALAIVDEMGGHKVDVVGHDWGAWVAWQLAARYPERLRTLTAVSVPHPAALSEAILSGKGDQAARSAYIAFFRQEGIAERTLLVSNGDGLRKMLLATGLPEEETDAYVGLMREPGALTAALSWYRAVSPEEAQGMGPITTPTMYVWSDQDVALGREAAEATAAHVEGPYRFEVIEGVSHWIPEVAGDELDALLLEHLSSWG